MYLETRVGMGYVVGHWSAEFRTENFILTGHSVTEILCQSPGNEQLWQQLFFSNFPLKDSSK